MFIKKIFYDITDLQWKYVYNIYFFCNKKILYCKILYQMRSVLLILNNMFCTFLWFLWFMHPNIYKMYFTFILNMKFLDNGPVNKVNRSYNTIKHLISWINSTTNFIKISFQRTKWNLKNRLFILLKLELSEFSKL